MSHSIHIEGIGPIREALDFSLQDTGGIVVLEGWNGVGKSSALRAVEALTNGNVPLDHTDGLERGLVEGFGVRVTVARSTRPTGRLQVKSLEGLNPMLLVDPGIKDPEKADDERIRVLSQLVRVRLENSDFARLVGGEAQLREVASEKALVLENPAEKAAAFKRDLQAAARKVEEAARVQEGRAEGLRQSVEGVNLAAPSDERELAAATEAAVRLAAEKEGEAKAARARLSKYADARKRLEDAASARGGVSSAEAGEQLKAARAAHAELAQVDAAAQEAVDAAERALSEARTRKRETSARVDAAAREIAAAERLLRSARDAEQSLADARALVDGDPGASGPSDEELAVLRAEIEACRKRQEAGAIVRQAKATLAQSESAAGEARVMRERAAELREAAEGCEELLTLAIQKVAPRGLRVRNGRLGLPTARSEFTLFGDLSDGERTKIALDVAIDALGEGAVFVLPQKFFEGLDPSNVAALHEHLVSRRCHMVTARAAAGPLRATQYAPPANGAPRNVQASTEDYQ